MGFSSLICHSCVFPCLTRIWLCCIQTCRTEIAGFLPSSLNGNPAPYPPPVSPTPAHSVSTSLLSAINIPWFTWRLAPSFPTRFSPLLRPVRPIPSLLACSFDYTQPAAFAPQLLFQLPLGMCVCFTVTAHRSIGSSRAPCPGGCAHTHRVVVLCDDLGVLKIAFAPIYFRTEVGESARHSWAPSAKEEKVRFFSEKKSALHTTREEVKPALPALQ